MSLATGVVHQLDGRVMPGRTERGHQIRRIGIDHARGAIRQDPRERSVKRPSAWQSSAAHAASCRPDTVR